MTNVQAAYPGRQLAPVHLGPEDLGGLGGQGRVLHRLMQGQPAEAPFEVLVGMLHLLQNPGVDPPCCLAHGIQCFIHLWTAQQGSAVLCCAVLCCAVLCCAVLCCALSSCELQSCLQHPLLIAEAPCQTT